MSHAAANAVCDTPVTNVHGSHLPIVDSPEHEALQALNRLYLLAPDSVAGKAITA